MVSLFQLTRDKSDGSLGSLIRLAYSSSSAKANEFLSYEKCMQRMKCPINRKEDCREECQAGRSSCMPGEKNISSCPSLGNTEEEVEEHTELIVNERRRNFKRAPKSKFETPTIKKHAEKDPSTLGKTQESNSSSLKKTEL